MHGRFFSQSLGYIVRRNHFLPEEVISVHRDIAGVKRFARFLH